MKVITKIYAVLSCLCCLLVAGPVFANEDAGSYSVQAIPNKNQIDPRIGYFYLLEKPGSKDQIEISLSNGSDKPKNLYLKVTDANTNRNGIIDYTGDNKNSKLLKEPLTSMVKAEHTKVTVPAKKTVRAKLNVTMPSKDLPGVTIGAVVVSEKDPNAKPEAQDTEKITVENAFEYTIGIVVTNHKDEKMNVNKSVELEKVFAQVYDGYRVVQANIANPNPYIFGRADIKGKVYDDKGKEVQSAEKKNVEIAPYSVFPFQMDYGKHNIEPGDYVFKGTVKTKKQKWDFEQKFTITKEEARSINKESVFQIFIPKKYRMLLWLAVILSTGSTIVVIVRYHRMAKKVKDQEEK